MKSRYDAKSCRVPCFFDESYGRWHALCSFHNNRARGPPYASGSDIRPPGSLPEEEVMKNLHTLQSLIDTFPEHGDRPALLALHKAGSERLSYAELADQVRKLARGLAEADVGPGDNVALLAGN